MTKQALRVRVMVVMLMYPNKIWNIFFFFCCHKSEVKFVADNLHEEGASLPSTHTSWISTFLPIPFEHRAVTHEQVQLQWETSTVLCLIQC